VNKGEPTMKSFIVTILDLLRNLDDRLVELLVLAWCVVGRVYAAGYRKGWEQGFQDGLKAMHKTTKAKARKR
jgi:hypothetical protein